jgi:hypothetical protein
VEGGGERPNGASSARASCQGLDETTAEDTSRSLSKLVPRTKQWRKITGSSTVGQAQLEVRTKVVYEAVGCSPCKASQPFLCAALCKWWSVLVEVLFCKLGDSAKEALSRL